MTLIELKNKKIKAEQEINSLIAEKIKELDPNNDLKITPNVELVSIGTITQPDTFMTQFKFDIEM